MKKMNLMALASAALLVAQISFAGNGCYVCGPQGMICCPGTVPVTLASNGCYVCGPQGMICCPGTVHNFTPAHLDVGFVNGPQGPICLA